MSVVDKLDLCWRLIERQWSSKYAKEREETPTTIDCPQIGFQTHSENKRERRVVITVYRRGSCPLATRRLSWEAIIRFVEL